MLVLAIMTLGGSAWLSHCLGFLERPVIALGILLLALSLAGLAGSLCRASCLLWLYLLALFLLIVLLFAFTVFVFAMTDRGDGRVVSSRGYKEYCLGDYSTLLQQMVENAENWDKIRRSLQDGKVCEKLGARKETLSQFVDTNLSPVQSECCKPPTGCNFTYQSETVWTKPSGFNGAEDPDCNKWSNDKAALCYDCTSCKAGVLANLKNSWKQSAAVYIVLLVFLVVVYSIGCWVFKNNSQDN